jgi:hypothetical protein
MKTDDAQRERNRRRRALNLTGPRKCLGCGTTMLGPRPDEKPSDWKRRTTHSRRCSTLLSNKVQKARKAAAE